MRIVLTTYPGERPLRPEFGCRLRDHVFGLVTPDELAVVATEVRDALERWEPRADIEDVDVHPSETTEGLLMIDIVYRVLDTDEQRVLGVPFERLPGEGG